MPNSWIAILDTTGRVIANASTDTLGRFSTPIPFLPSLGLTYVAGGGAGSGKFTTDVNSFAFVAVPVPTTTRIATTTLAAWGRVWGMAASDSWVAILDANRPVIANVSTDATGAFSTAIPYLPNKGLFCQASGVAGLGIFTTDSHGAAYLVIPTQTTTWTATTTSAASGLVWGTALPDSWVAIVDASGALVANASTDSLGSFSAPIPFFPNSTFTYRAGGGAGSGKFATDSWSIARLVIGIPTTTRPSTTTPAASGRILETAVPNSWIAVVDTKGTLVANVSTDSLGSFSITIPFFPNSGFTYQAGGGAGSGNFTTDSRSTAYLVVGIPTTTRPSTTTPAVSGLVWGTVIPNFWVAIVDNNGAMVAKCLQIRGAPSRFQFHSFLIRVSRITPGAAQALGTLRPTAGASRIW